MTSLNSAKIKARDAVRRSDMRQVQRASELYYFDNDINFSSDGWISNPGSVNTSLVNGGYYPNVPIGPSGDMYMHWRKDFTGYSLPGTPAGREKYAIYCKLENPSAGDLSTISDAFDMRVQAVWGMNYKVGNQ